MIFFFFFSTIVVGGIIGDLSNLYLERKEDEIEQIIIDSTVWVHKSDLDGQGTISEADYILVRSFDFRISPNTPFKG
jgi:hypothetical protein